MTNRLLLLAVFTCLAMTIDDSKPSRAILDAVNHPDRPAEDKQRDADRKPADVLAFYGVEPGMKVADLMTGGGYYAEVLARVVGPNGHVISQNNETSARVYGNQIRTRLEGDRLKNVEYVIQELDALKLSAGELDAVFMVLFYHDTYWMGVDRAKMNRLIFESLKPGGTFAVIDHQAEAGSGDRDARDRRGLHRVDAERVKKEILDAGFEWAGESDILHNTQDDRTKNVFTPGLRGKTDQFVFRFRKPKAE